jgi:hypothetical protein
MEVPKDISESITAIFVHFVYFIKVNQWKLDVITKFSATVHLPLQAVLALHESQNDANACTLVVYFFSIV